MRKRSVSEDRPKHTLTGYDGLPFSVSSWHHTHAERPLTHGSLSGRAVCVWKMNVCVLMDWVLGQPLHHSYRHTLFSRAHTHTHLETHTDTQLAVRCLHMGERAVAKIHPLFYYLFYTHTHIHTNHVEQRLQLERVFSWLSVQFPGRAKCGS